MVANSRHLVLTSHELDAELREVIRRKALITAAEQSLLLAALQKVERIAIPDPTFTPVCRDPDDDRVLACAVSGSADVILSGDLDLLTLNPFRGIRILTPRQFPTEEVASNPVP